LTRLGRSLWLMATPLLMLLLALLFLATSGNVTGREAGYPRVLAGLVGALALVSLVRDHSDGHRAADPEPHGADDDLADPDELEGRRGAGVAVRRILAFLGVSGLAVVLMSYLGFFVPAFLLLAGGLVVLGVRTPWKVVVYSVGVVLTAYLLFVEALKVPFPPAPWS
jgi:hypothetical protein